MKHKSEKFKRNATWAIAIAILAVMFCLSFFAARGDSGTTDEIAHIPSGYSYLKYHDFRLNPEHPPLAKVLAGSLLQFVQITDLRQNWSWDGVNQWEAGWNMLYRSGNSTSQILSLSRFSMILLAVTLGLVLFFWAKKMWGRRVALFVLALFAFYPDVLGHSHLVTTDIAAAFGFVIAVFAFDNLLRKQTARALVWSGIAFGLAQLLKFSSVLLFGILLVYVLYWAKLAAKEGEGYWQAVWRYFKSYFWTCVIALALIWIAYIPLVWNMSPEITHKVIDNNITMNPNYDVIRNLLHAMEGNPITRAIAHYFLGVVLVFLRVAGGNATFIMGHVSDKSISWFFPVAWLLKTPLSVIFLFIWSLISLAIFRNKHKEDSWQNWLILTPVVVYWAFTLKGSLNIGIRHLMPTVPFVLLFIGKSMKRYLNYEKMPTIQGVIATFLLIVMVIETLSYYPQYIAYFNMLVPRDKRYQYLVDSSLDWGQDLYRLKDYVDEKGIETIKTDYFGGSVPPIFIPQSTEWHSSYGPTTGWLAISATYFQSSKLYGPKEGKWDYEWLEDYQPEAIIGGSILVYNITNQDLANNPPVSKYPITVIEKPGDIQVYKDTPSLNNQ